MRYSLYPDISIQRKMLLIKNTDKQILGSRWAEGDGCGLFYSRY